MADKKILVVYYSRTGTTERVAKDIAAKLNADIENLIDLKDRSGVSGYLYGGRDAMRKFTTELGAVSKDPGDYDTVVIGTPTWAWDMTPAVRTYIEKFKGQIKDIACFATSGGSDAEKVAGNVEALAGKKAVALAGYRAPDLRNKTKYEEKFSAFIDAVKGK